ncbi:shikimate dehydrogenase [Pelagibacterium xiamenense]|uniref:shikimate dehydrogenase n=1 Tax=Pelagibacterium xiamenense TaxID=2901140 RepID=UPI001E3EE907|nr:shikimate dehydrogenase [Pelagibacterium xiamenense]MCD7058429.1 shikimate dehydrogenase [Pelagibacterium xiamenense]
MISSSSSSPAAFVIGHPIAHSKSPLIHGYWLERYGISGSYRAFDVAPADLEAFMARLRGREFVGGNITIPHKEAVMAHCDVVDPLAGTIGAVNTLVRRGQEIHGSNTDYLGFLANLDAGAPGWDGDLKTAIVLGAGGAARAVLAALIARETSRIVILNRTPERAQALARDFGPSVTLGRLEDFAVFAPEAGLLVNTTSIGMGGTRFDDLPLETLGEGAVVNDIVYTPLVTPLLADARAHGYAVVDGLGMLLHQATPGFAAWFGKDPEVTTELRARIVSAMGL